MLRKFEKFGKGYWLLIKKFPDDIEICPNCENVWFSDPRKHMEEIRNSKSATEDDEKCWRYIKCQECGLTYQGPLLYRFWEYRDKFMNNFDFKNKTLEDFLDGVHNLCEKMKKLDDYNERYEKHYDEPAIEIRDYKD